MAKEDKEVANESVKAKASRFDMNSLNSLAVVSLATSVTGFGAVAGIITGHIALAQLKTNPKSGRALAIAGVVVGYAFLALAIFGTIARAIWGHRYGLEPIGPLVGGREDIWQGGQLGDMRGPGDMRFGDDDMGMHGNGGWMMDLNNPTDAPTPEVGGSVN